MAGYDFEFYETGKISVTAGQKAFTGSGTAWKLRGCEGALVVVVGAGTVNFVSSLSTDAAGEFRTAWAGPTLANASYVMWLPSAVAATALANHQRLAEIISSIQTAQPASDILAALAGLTLENRKLIVATGQKTFDTTTLSDFAKSLLARSGGAQIYGDLGIIPEAQIPGRISGVQSSSLNDANTLTQSGWYYAGGAMTNRPPSGTVGMILALFQLPTHGTQIYFDRQNNSQSYRRVCADGVWTDWQLLSANDYSQAATEQGWCRLPNGLIVQWGRSIVTTSATNAGSITLPTTFPNNHFTHVLTNGDWGVSAARSATLVTVGREKNSISFATSGIAASITIRVNFWAIGN